VINISEYLKRFYHGLLTYAVFYVIWEALHYVSGSPAVPDMSDIAYAILNLRHDTKFMEHFISTMGILLKGILIGSVSGFALGVICDISNGLKAVICGLVHFLKGIPAIALFPLILAVLGIGDESRIAIITWTAFPPVFISTVFGLSSVDKDVIGAAETYGANKYDVVSRIKIPMSATEIMNGFKISIGTGFISVVTAEMLGANKGIGYMILWSTNAFRYKEVYAYIFVVAVMGFVMNYISDQTARFLEKRLFE
jgi:ABC-type nitrate/sulfonate/bicarbonate transport system permease component